MGDTRKQIYNEKEEENSKADYQAKDSKEKEGQEVFTQKVARQTTLHLIGVLFYLSRFYDHAFVVG